MEIQEEIQASIPERWAEAEEIEPPLEDWVLNTAILRWWLAFHCHIDQEDEPTSISLVDPQRRLIRIDNRNYLIPDVCYVQQLDPPRMDTEMKVEREIYCKN